MGLIRNLVMKALRIEYSTIENSTVGAVTPSTGKFSNLAMSVSTVAATGSTNADAATLGAGLNLATGADATKGVILPSSPVVGQIVRVKNVAAAVLKVYPNSGAAINGLTATTGALSMAASTFADFVYTNTNQWYSLPLLPS